MSRVTITTYSTAPFNCSGFPEIRYYYGICHWKSWHIQKYTSTAAAFFPATRFPTKAPVRSAAPSVSMSPTIYIPAAPSNRFGYAAKYVVTVLYSDSACKTPYYASFQRLRTCYRSIDDENLYLYIIATDNTLTTTTYTDSVCKLRANQTLSSFTNACVGMRRMNPTNYSTVDFGQKAAIR